MEYFIFPSYFGSKDPGYQADYSCMNGLTNEGVLLEDSSLEVVDSEESSFRSWRVTFLKRWDINGPYGYGQGCL